MDSKEIEIGGRKYRLNKIPAFQAQKIAFSCLNALKAKDLSLIPDEIVWKLLAHVEALNGMGGAVKLENEDLVAINVADAGVLMTLEMNQIEYNFGFFFDGSLLSQMKALFGRLTASLKKGETAAADS